MRKTAMRQVIQAGATAGAIGAVVMVLAQAIARLAAGVPTFPDLVEDLATRMIPPVIFSHVLDALKFEAKPLLFVSLLVLQIIAGAVGGAIFGIGLGREIDRENRWRGWLNALLGAAALWLITNLVLLPIAGQGFFGARTPVGPIALNLALVVGFLLYGLSTAGSYRVLAPMVPLATPEAALEKVLSPERRRVLGGVVAGTVTVLAAAATYKVLTPEKLAGAPAAGAQKPPPGPPSPVQSAGPRPATSAPPLANAAGAPAPVVAPATPASETSAPTAIVPAVTPLPTASNPPEWQIPGLTAEMTPTKDFYYVAKDFFVDPVIDPSRWVLEITGAVKSPVKLSYNQLLKLPPIERYQTLECISNGVGGLLISNAAWRGVSLRDLIAACGPNPTTKKVVFYAADDYQDSVTFDRAMSPENLLVYAMNGEPLLPPHGAPARLLLPGIYGMKNVKWLTKIELVPHDFQGYWQQRGWSDQAYIKTMSRIDAPVPSDDSPIYKAGRLTVAGIAFGGDKGIGKVEASLDGGRSWQEAKLKEPLDKYTWRLWELTTPAGRGTHRIVVRATDGEGKLQTEQIADTLPDGATGWHWVEINL